MPMLFLPPNVDSKTIVGPTSLIGRFVAPVLDQKMMGCTQPQRERKRESQLTLPFAIKPSIYANCVSSA